MENLVMMMRRQPDPEFWLGKRVLLTGHTGFKGSWMSLWLQQMGADLFGYALPAPTQPALFDVANVAKGMNHCIGDVRNLNSITRFIRDVQPEVVIHMAAQPLVRLSYQNPVETFATNVMGTVHVIDASRQCESVKAIVNVTTDKCYANQEWEWAYRENDALGGHDPYSSSKACSELVSEAYRNSFLIDSNISLATARAGNVIGGGDWALDRLIPDTLRSLEKKEAVRIRNPNAIRPWQHVLEPLSGYLILAENLYKHKKMYSEAWNFGPNHDDSRPVSWVVEKLCSIWGEDGTWNSQDGTHPHEANLLNLDISKARNRLHWVPHWSIEMALEQTANWHKSWLNGQDMHDVCLHQISQFGARK